MSVAIVYDGSIRDNGTPYLFRYAFREVLGEEIAWYTPAGKIPAGHEFYFRIDDGRDDLDCEIPGRWGYYATDTHLGPGPRFEKARRADVVWCAQKPAAEALRAEGVNASWLPLACSPAHHPTALEIAEREDKPIPAKEYDVAFVGHLQPPDQTDRIAFLDAMFKAFPNFRFESGRFHADMASVYHRSRIGVNHAVRDDLNMRAFELASAGVTQLLDDRMVGLRDLGFEPWVHYIPYDSPLSAVRNAERMLREDEARQLMAAEARQLVRSAHTYAHRVRAMLTDAGCES